jgi:predicted helicase
LNNDYVRFLAFGQDIIEATRTGILGMITSSSFLQSIVHRGMRYELLSTFAPLYCFDLHGESLPGREREVDSISGPANVFDIQEGVAITIGVKLVHEQRKRGLYHAEIKGSRDQKYSFLFDNSVNTTDWFIFQPSADTGSLFSTIVLDLDGRQEGVYFPDMFLQYSTGITTFRDHFAVAFSKNELLERINTTYRLANKPASFAAQFNLKNGRGLHIFSFLKAIAHSDIDKSEVRGYLFAPFDHRFVWYRTDLLGAPRTSVSEHMLSPNIAILTTRQTKEKFGVFVTRLLPSHKVVAKYEGTYFAPLFVNDHASPLQPSFFADNQTHNFDSRFLETFAETLDLLQKPGQVPKGITAYDILHYTYAVMNSDGYQDYYGGYLMIDFPRLPITSNLDFFRTLTKLGGELVALHLVEFALEDEPDAPTDWPRYPRLAHFDGDNPTVEKFPSAKNAWREGRVAINRNSGFIGFPEEVWNFHIGGYQVCHKWLKDRKGRTLSDADIHHYCKIVTALHQTILLMAQIDEVIEEHGGWPIE